MQHKPEPDSTRIAVVGLGYVGLPLAVEFGKQYRTVGYDISTERIEQLLAGRDRTGEIEPGLIAGAQRLSFTSELREIAGCNVYIVTVPTPVNEHKQPDFTPLIRASQAIGSVLEPGDLVIYESTVFPGATEEVCVPELERASGLAYEAAAAPASFLPPGSSLAGEVSAPVAGQGGGRRGVFSVGYSPERINPGDRERRLADIPKVTSGSTPATADFVDALYRSILHAGTHKAASIKVAEASKVIENTQRDANIALINEFALIFHRLGIDTNDVLEAAATKWNFLPFRPGLVGGHCIGVDPYYLIQKAQSVGYHPDVLTACRRINDAMGQHVAAEVVKLMIGKGHAIKGARVLVLGFTFKEDCPDLRNTRVIDLVRELEAFGAQVDIHDPWADAAAARQEYGVQLLEEWPGPGIYDAVVIAVAHHQFRQDGGRCVRTLANGRAVIYDIKGVLPREFVDGRL